MGSSGDRRLGARRRRAFGIVLVSSRSDILSRKVIQYNLRHVRHGGRRRESVVFAIEDLDRLKAELAAEDAETVE